MKKLLILGVMALLVIGGAGGAGYYYYLHMQPKEDHSIIVVDTTVGKPVPPPFSVTGKVFAVPAMDGVTTTINLIFPSTRRDYGMGRFTSPDGKITGRLVVDDDFVSPYFNNRRALPISVNIGGPEDRYYLAILEGDNLRHATSVPIGDRIKVTAISRHDDIVTLSYNVHDRNQSMDEIPTIGTTAEVNIATGVLVQAGRNPQTEEVVADKFTGKYFWVSTKYADGKIVKPDTLDYFAVAFNGSAITLETDCNTGGAAITVGASSSSVFTVGTIDATKKTCSSQYEGEYFAMFSKVTSYSQLEGGKLLLKFADGGSMQFIAEAMKNGVPVQTLATSTATSSATSTKR